MSLIYAQGWSPLSLCLSIPFFYPLLTLKIKIGATIMEVDVFAIRTTPKAKIVATRLHPWRAQNVEAYGADLWDMRTWSYLEKLDQPYYKI